MTSKKRTEIKKKNENILRMLEEITEKVGIVVEYEKFMHPMYSGDICRIKDKHRIIINKDIDTKSKIEVLLKSLNEFDLNGIFVPPVIRELLEETKNNNQEIVKRE